MPVPPHYHPNTSLQLPGGGEFGIIIRYVRR